MCNFQLIMFLFLDTFFFVITKQYNKEKKTHIKTINNNLILLLNNITISKQKTNKT